MKHRHIFGIAALALLGSSLTSPIASAQSVRSISAKDKAEGAKAHPQLLQEFGGAYTSGAQSAYVTRVGQNIAVQSGLSNARSDFTVTLLNSPVNNAFAIPGGYVYVTRQLMGLMNDEAELAGVLGHEVGHVAARHSQERKKASTRNSILGVLGTVLGAAIGGDGSGFGGLIGRGLQEYSGTMAQVLTLKFSRSQETQADDLGINYLRRAGYDTDALSSMLASLANQTNLEARVSGQNARSAPEWASTHPDPASRVTRALNQARKVGGTEGMRNRDQFLNALDGVMYDDDPRQGVVEGNSFRHPDLKLAFTIPNGYGMSNGTSAVTISGTNGKAMFTTQRYDGNMQNYVDTALKAVLGNAQAQYGETNRTTINGIPAYFRAARAATQQGQVDVMVVAYEFSPSNAYHFVTMTQAGRSDAFNPMFNSVRRLSASEAAQIRPRQIDVVTVGAGDTVARLAARMAYPNYQQERFMVLNGLTSGQALTRGQRVKIVTY